MANTEGGRRWADPEQKGAGAWPGAGAVGRGPLGDAGGGTVSPGGAAGPACAGGRCTPKHPPVSDPKAPGTPKIPRDIPNPIGPPQIPPTNSSGAWGVLGVPPKGFGVVLGGFEDPIKSFWGSGGILGPTKEFLGSCKGLGVPLGEFGVPTGALGACGEFWGPTRGFWGPGEILGSHHSVLAVLGGFCGPPRFWGADQGAVDTAQLLQQLLHHRVGQEGHHHQHHLPSCPVAPVCPVWTSLLPASPPLHPSAPQSHPSASQSVLVLPSDPCSLPVPPQCPPNHSPSPSQCPPSALPVLPITLPVPPSAPQSLHSPQLVVDALPHLLQQPPHRPAWGGRRHWAAAPCTPHHPQASPFQLPPPAPQLPGVTGVMGVMGHRG